MKFWYQSSFPIISLCSRIIVLISFPEQNQCMKTKSQKYESYCAVSTNPFELFGFRPTAIPISCLPVCEKFNV